MELVKLIKKHVIEFSVIVMILIGVFAYNMYQEYIVNDNDIFEPFAQSFEVDINSEFDYDITKYIKVKHGDPDEVFANMITTILEVRTDKINEFYIVNRYKKEKKGFWIKVVDKTSPICLPKRMVTYYSYQQFNAMDFIYDYEDESPVMFYVWNEPKFKLDFIGEKTITIVCEDNSGNKTFVPQLTVNVIDGKQPVLDNGNGGSAAITTKITKANQITTAPPKTTSNANDTTTTRKPVTAPAPMTTTWPVIILPENTTRPATTTASPITSTIKSNKYYLKEYAWSSPSQVPIGKLSFSIKDDIQSVINNGFVYPKYVRGSVDINKPGLYNVIYGTTYNGVYSETIAPYQVYQPMKPDPSTLYLWDSTYGDKSCKWSVNQTCKTIVLEGDMKTPKILIEGASNDPNGLRLRGYNANGGESTGLSDGKNVFYVIWNYNQEVLGEIVIDLKEMR